MANQKQYVAVWPSGQHLRWRGLSLKEFRSFSRRLDYESEMVVYCDLYQLVANHDDNPTLDKVTAGIVDFLGRTLLKNNPYSGDIEAMKKALEVQREALQVDYIDACKAVIAGVFRYTFEEIEEWDSDTFFSRLAKAELISGEDLGPKTVEKEKPGEPKSIPKVPKRPLTPTQARVLERRAAARSAN